MTHVIYIVKLVLLYITGGVLVSSLTSGLNPVAISSWWTEPIFYQKLVLWTVLLECLGLAGSWGPMAGHFKPFTCGWRTHLRVDTIRQPPWSRVPFTRGDRRTGFDVFLYVAVLATLVAALGLPGVADAASDATRLRRRSGGAGRGGRARGVDGRRWACATRSSSCRPAGSSTCPPSSSSPPSPRWT